MESIRIIEEKVAQVKTVLGISEILFGLVAGAREIVNSVFLYYCYYSTRARLDLAILNAQIPEFAGISEQECRLAEASPFNVPPVDVAADHQNAAHLRVPSHHHSLQEDPQKVRKRDGAATDNERGSLKTQHGLGDTKY